MKNRHNTSTQRASIRFRRRRALATTVGVVAQVTIKLQAELARHRAGHRFGSALRRADRGLPQGGATIDRGQRARYWAPARIA